MSQGEKIVHLAEVAYGEVETDRGIIMPGPWTGYETRDTLDRRWLIQKSTLHTSFSLKSTNTLNTDVESQTATLLEPPYEVVWLPNPLNYQGVSFSLAAS